MDEPGKSFEGYAIVEVFGHSQIAGYVSEQLVGGSPMVRVDVPAVDGKPAFTKCYGPKAIYAVTPTDEATAKMAAQAFRTRPVDEWTLPTPKALPPVSDHDFYGSDGRPLTGEEDDGIPL